MTSPGQPIASRAASLDSTAHHHITIGTYAGLYWGICLPQEWELAILVAIYVWATAGNARLGTRRMAD